MLDAIINELLANMHTAQPGRFISFDRNTRLASVQPVLKRKYIDSETATDLPQISDVPVIFPGSANFQVVFDITPGSYGLLIFCERAIAQWIEKGGIVDPIKKRKFHLSDAIVIPGIFSKADAFSPIANGTIEIRKTNGSSFIRMESSGKVNINGNLTVEP